MNRNNILFLLLSAVILSNCNPSTELTLEDVANGADVKAFLDYAYRQAQQNVPQTSIAAINRALRPHDRLYRPERQGRFPTVLFFHGCSGATLSHEQDWAAFYNAINVAMIAVDSYSGRGIDWQAACDFKVMTPWQRAADVLATIEYARTLDFVDSDKLILSGFSHGAMTTWQAQVYASQRRAPVSLAQWPDNGFDGVALNFSFYGTCTNRWDIELPTTMFLGDNDRYINEQDCIDYAQNNSDMNEFFNYYIFSGAPHNFDHATPSQVNLDAGAFYDEAATLKAQVIISEAIAKLN